MDMQDTINI